MLKLPTALWAGPLALLVVAGCIIEAGNNIATARTLLKDKAGEQCTIQFRRDANGGALLLISGRLKTYTQDGAMLEHDGRESCIPSESILLIRF